MNAIVLVHGLAAHPVVWLIIAKYLRKRCSRVINWGYPSILRSIQDHANELSRLLEKLDADPSIDRIHLVTHSMGGIVARTALIDRIPAKMGRMVMLAPPNLGSRAAAFFGPLLGRICRPIRELMPNADSFVCSLPAPQGFEVGVITARNDFLVAPELTLLAGECDRTQVPSWHSGMLFRTDTAEQVHCFLETGHFAH